MTIALAILCLALVGLLVYERRVGARSDEVATRLLVQLQQSAEQERLRHAEERRELYQRIQAPETAVLEHVRKDRGDRPYIRRRPIAADDDKRFLERDGRETSEDGEQ